VVVLMPMVVMMVTVVRFFVSPELSHRFPNDRFCTVRRFNTT